MEPIVIRKELLSLSGKVFSKAFDDDPFISYVFPDIMEKRKKSPIYWHLALKYAYL